MSIDPIVASVSRVISYKNDKQQKTGSGFFYLNNSKLYFITNRHMVIKEDENYYPDEISLRLHLDPKNIQNNADFQIPLYQNEKPSWKEHPQHGSKIDVVALPLDEKEITSTYFIRPFTPKDHIPNDIIIPLGQELMVIGFPKGFSDKLNNLPITRDASLGSVYPVPFQGNPFLLIEAHLHGGTSGSPVVTKPMNMVQTTGGSTQIRTGNTRYLLGIHSASVDVKNSEDKDPLGLNCVWFASLIDEITK